jgi:hypothetical protein
MALNVGKEVATLKRMTVKELQAKQWSLRGGKPGSPQGVPG